MWRWASIGAVALALAAAPAHASTPVASASASAAIDIPLPELPPMPAIESPVPSRDAQAELQSRLDALSRATVAGPFQGEAALGPLTRELDPAVVPAIAKRMSDLRGELEGRRAERMLERARKVGRRELRRLKRARKKSGDKTALPDGDWLVFLLSLEEKRRATTAWKHAVELYGMLRMLEAVGDTPAVREMIASYSYFGELVRIDLQRAFTRLGDKSVPALIEAKKHDARKVRRLARKQLDRLGRAIPGESVSMTDPRVLADVLLAFGRVRDVDATRVVLSFCNSDRAQLRDAARAAVGAIGEPAKWHLKDTYLNLTGKKAPRKWDWKRSAQELFRVHDRARLASVYALMNQGKAAADAGKWDEATKKFDEVLAHDPLFPARERMALAYHRRGEELAKAKKRKEALVALRKSLRMAPKSKDKKAIEARMTLLEAQMLVDAGTPDRILIERALELDPGNEEAKALLAGLAEKAEKRKSRMKNYVGAAGVGVVAMVLMLLLARRREPVAPQARGDDPEGNISAAADEEATTPAELAEEGDEGDAPTPEPGETPTK